MISVIMSTYKENESQLRQSIESILNQTYTDFEYIIILDYPENELHKSIIRDYASKDKRIRFYVNDKNIGLAESLNRGIQLANGDYIARMDADDISLPDRLENQFKYLTANNYDLIGGITQMINENGELIYNISKVPSNFNKIKKALKYGQVIAHPTWLGKKDVFVKLNGYRKIPLCEDYDFTLRAILKGYTISNINKTVLQYRMTSNSISRNNLYDQYLYAKYIAKEYSKGNVADIDQAKQYVTTKYTQRKSKKYSESNVIFNRMLSELSNKQLLPFIIDGFKLVFHSFEFMDKIYRFVRLTLISK